MPKAINRFKDKRYILVGHCIKDGRITTFQGIFDLLPKSVLAAGLWMNNAHFEKLRNNISLFRVRDLFRIAELLEITELDILILVKNQYLEDKETQTHRFRSSKATETGHIKTLQNEYYQRPETVR